MDSVNKTLYIPLYGKAKSKWLAYYMAMRAAVYDEWVREEIRKNPAAMRTEEWRRYFTAESEESCLKQHSQFYLICTKEITYFTM